MRKISYVLTLLCSLSAAAQEQHVNPEALGIHSYVNKANETMSSLLLQSYQKKHTSFAWDIYSRALSADSTLWWTMMGGANVKVSKLCKIGVLVGYETQQHHIRAAGWFSARSENERWRLFALYEFGASRAWSKVELFYRFSKEEHPVEIQIGVLSHEARVGPLLEIAYKNGYLIASPYLYNFDEPENTSMLVAVGLRLK